MKLESQQLALLYVRRSTNELKQPTSLANQERTLIELAESRGYKWELISESESASTISKRPALTEALNRLDSGKAQLLMTTNLDRLSRSVGDFAHLLARSEKKGWAFICLDVQVDTSTPAGKFIAFVMVSASQLERELIGKRTREGLAQRKREGVVLGRPKKLSEGVRQRALTLRQQGASLQAIANQFNQEKLETAHAGASWYPSTISKLLARQAS